MAQRRRRRARCMLHCPQRHVLGMRGWISACALRARCGGSDRGARWRTACYGNRDGCTHTDAHDRYPDFIPRPDETPSPNGQHAHVTHPVPDIVIEICWLTRPRPVTGKFSVSPSTAHSAILFSWQTHETRGYPSDQLTAPAQTLPSLPQPFSDCSLHRHARNCHSTCT
jgi:hypothetical protein